MTKVYPESIRKQFEYYKMPGDQTFPQVDDDKLFWQYHEDKQASQYQLLPVNYLPGAATTKYQPAPAN
jgi:hypothetical protein